MRSTLLLLLAASCAVAAHSPGPPAHGAGPGPAPPRDGLTPRERADRLRSECLARQERIETELATLEDHPWAGIYVTSGPFQSRLSLAPRGGFTLYRGSHCGNCSGWRVGGRVVTEGSTQLAIEREVGCHPSVAGDPPAWWCLDERIHLVPWGELTFAIFDTFLEPFYLLVNDGHSYPGHLFALARCEEAARQHQERSRPEGTPFVVPGHEHLVLREPIEAFLGSLLEWGPSPLDHPGGTQHHHALYTLDLGSRHGLVDGMHLFIVGGGALSRRRGTLEDVGEHQSRIRFRGLREDSEPAATEAPGALLSSLHAKARRSTR